MKKILLLPLLLIITFTLSACEPPDPLEVCLEDDSCYTLEITEKTSYWHRINELIKDDIYFYDIEYSVYNNKHIVTFDVNIEAEMSSLTITNYMDLFTKIESLSNQFFNEMTEAIDVEIELYVTVVANEYINVDSNAIQIHSIENIDGDNWKDYLTIVKEVLVYNASEDDKDIRFTSKFYYNENATEYMTIGYLLGNVSATMDHYSPSHRIIDAEIQEYFDVLFIDYDGQYATAD